MELQATINEILEQRRQKQEDVTRYYNRTCSIQKNINSIKNIVDNSIWNNMISLEDRTNWENLKTKIDKLKDTVDKNIGGDEKERQGVIYDAKNRAEREWLNLGFIGARRQGKSTVIQKLIKLNGVNLNEEKSFVDWLLPSDGGENCTATTINVINNAYKSDDGKELEHVAVIHRYSIKEMCEILNEYFKLDGNCNISVNTNDKIEFLNFCDRYKNYKFNFEEAFHKTLSNYLEHAKEYVDYLTGEDELLTNLDSEAEKRRKYYSYVSYRTEPGQVIMNNFICLATKSVDVYTKFSIQGERVEKIRLLDTPGIGEQKIGVNSALENALKKDIDIAVAVARINDQDGFDRDIEQFHTIIKQQLSRRNSKDMLFYLYNIHTDKNAPDETLYEKRIKTIDDQLQDNIGGAQGLCLSDDHKYTIACFADKFLTSSNPKFNKEGNPILDGNNAITTLVYRILLSTIRTIKDTDAIFYRDAESQYSSINYTYENICNEYKKLLENIVVPDVNTKINDLIKNLGEQLNNYIAPISNITNSLQKNVLTFLENDDYVFLKDILQIEGFSISDDVAKDVDTIITKYPDNIGTKPLRSNIYEQGHEFSDYHECKIRLFTKIKADIIERININEALTKLSDIKNTVYKIWLEYGYLSNMFNNNSEEFEKGILNTLKDCPNIKTIFDNFINFTITKEDMMKTCVTSLKRCFHSDDFNPDPQDVTLGYEFNTYEGCRKSFIYSLLKIEKKVRNDLQDNNFEIKTIEQAIRDQISNMQSIFVNKETIGSTQTYNELQSFYQKHLSLLPSDDNTKKAEVKTKLQSLIDTKL